MSKRNRQRHATTVEAQPASGRKFFYVAGSSLEVTRAIQFVEALGLDRCTYSWAHELRREHPGLGGPVLNDRLTREQCDEILDRCLAGATTADLVIVLSGKDSIGAWFEMGAAVEAGIPILWVGRRKSIVWAKASVYVLDDAEGISAARIILGGAS